MPGRAAVVRELRVDEAPKAAAFCSIRVCAQVPWLEQEGHQTHMHWWRSGGYKPWNCVIYA